MKNKPLTAFESEFVTEYKLDKSKLLMKKISTRGKKKLINEKRSQMPEEYLAELDKKCGVEGTNNIILYYNLLEKRILKKKRTVPYGEFLAELKEYYQGVFSKKSDIELKKISDVAQSTHKHQCQMEDSQQKSGLLFSVEEFDYLMKSAFRQGRCEGLNIGVQLIIDIDDLWSMVLDDLIKSGKIQKQAGLKLRRAFELAFSKGVPSVRRSIGKNLPEQLRLRLIELGLGKDEVNKKVRDQLAKEFGTNYPTITDALSKIRSEK
jgi:hypothetical protein